MKEMVVIGALFIGWSLFLEILYFIYTILLIIFIVYDGDVYMSLGASISLFLSLSPHISIINSTTRDSSPRYNSHNINLIHTDVTQTMKIYHHILTSYPYMTSVTTQPRRCVSLRHYLGIGESWFGDYCVCLNET